ncbi:hypothetical protein FQN57_004130 [Myotisia sp. PD_48]|nr:hypothetical protein FQN57_004130 [Myotisia sp. PD_48]
MDMDIETNDLPKIKCSDCHAEVELISLGEHVCSKQPLKATTTLNPEADRPQPLKRGLSRESLFNRLGRVLPPPPIDPSAANRPFLSSPFSISPLSPSPRSPFRQPPRSQTSPLPPRPPPSPERTNLDCAFPPFPRSASASSSKKKPASILNRQSQTLRLASPDGSEYSNVSQPAFDTPELSPNLEKGSPEDGHRRPRSRSRANRHRREVSIDSKSLQRISLASARFNGLPSPISPAGIYPGMSNGVEEIPPLPTASITGFAISSDLHMPDASRSDHTQKESHQNGNILQPDAKRQQAENAILDFGILSRTSSPERISGYHEAQYNDSALNPSQNSTATKLPSHQADEKFSMSNFARGLGMADPYHNTNDSTSSSSSAPSEAPSGGSFSSRPSETSSVSEPKSAMSEKLSDHPIEHIPPPPPNPYHYDLDSPTDPLFQHGRLSKPPSRQGRRPDTQSPPPQPEPQPQLPPPPPSPSHTTDASTDKVQQPQVQKADPPPRLGAPAKPRRTRCRGCHEIITGKSVSCADGRLTGRYHKACFVCYTCQSPFQTADFYILDNNPYCAHHYHLLNGTLCCTCDKGIEGPCLETEEPLNPPSEGTKLPNHQNNESKQHNKKYHPDCFKCRTCRIVLTGDYFDWNGHIYCERDGRRAALHSQQQHQPQPHNQNQQGWNHPPASHSMHPLHPPHPPHPSHSPHIPPPGPPYQRPPFVSSPLAGAPAHHRPGDSRYRPMHPSSLGPGPGPGRGPPSPGPGSSMQKHNSNMNGNPQARNPPTNRRFPERRTTKLMMV